MGRSLAERVQDPVWWLEQAAHGLAGVGCSVLGASLALVWLPPMVAAGIGTGLAAAAAIVRELVQNLGDEDGSVADAVADAVCWTLCGAIAMIPLWVVAAVS